MLWRDHVLIRLPRFLTNTLHTYLWSPTCSLLVCQTHTWSWTIQLHEIMRLRSVHYPFQYQSSLTEWKWVLRHIQDSRKAISPSGCAIVFMPGSQAWMLSSISAYLDILGPYNTPLNSWAARYLQASTSSVVEGLFSALASMACVPIIRCPKVGPKSVCRNSTELLWPQP